MGKKTKKSSKFKPHHFLIVAGLLLINYIALHIGHAISLTQLHEGMTIEIAMAWFQFNVTRSPFVPFTTLFNSLFTFLVPLVASFLIMALYVTNKEKRKAFRAKKEHGSAHFAKVEDFNHLLNPENGQSIILSQDIKLSLDHHATGTNINICIIGGPGSGKTRGFMINLAHKSLDKGANMVITDPKGNLLKSVGKFLKKQGYTIKVLHLSNIGKSDFYNPFTYMRMDNEGNQAQILSLIEVIIKSTDTSADGKGGGNGDAFWTNAEKLLLQALFFYVLEVEPKERQSIVTVLELLDETSFGDDYEEGAKSGLAKRFALLEEQNPASLAVSFWEVLT